jgi:hypothetical protein
MASAAESARTPPSFPPARVAMAVADTAAVAEVALTASCLEVPNSA